MSTAGPPRPMGSLGPAPGRRRRRWQRWLWPQGGTSSRSAWRPGRGQRPPRAPVPAVRSLPPGGSPCPVPASSKHCAPMRQATQTPTRSPGRTDPVAFTAAARSTPSSARAPGCRSRSLRSLSRNCHADRPLAGVHRGPPAHGIPRKVTQTPELRRPPRSIPGGTALWPARRLQTPWKLL